LKPRIPGAVLVTVPLVVLLVALAVALPLITRHDQQMVSDATAPTTAPASTDSATLGSVSPSATSAAPRATPRATGHRRHHATVAPVHPRHHHRGAAAPSGTATTCVPQDRVRQLTVVTFNIHSARAPSGRVEVGTIAAELAAWHPDIVLLQEVDRGRAWSGRVDMPAVIAGRLHMSSVFGANVVRSATNQYGTAVLSRFPITSSHNTLLPAPAGTQQRGLLHAVVDVDGTELSVYDTHLENTSRTARDQQIRAIMPVLRADARPKLFGGDLNSVPGSQVVTSARSLLTDTWTALDAGAGLTAPAGHPRVRIDYLLFGNGAGSSFTPRSVAKLHSAVSDHYAVRAQYQLTTTGADVCVPDLTGAVGG
jgi:endonuclease/exonuclease/phosphatase family metal-dependent hydrolase